MKINFNAGDTVQLKSGGEIMTIEEIDEIGQLAFDRMIKKGLEDSKNGKIISSKEMGLRIQK